jgi:hypothetical protein
MINVHISSLAPAMVMDIVVPRLDTLEKIISSLIESNAKMQPTESMDMHERVLYSTNSQLLRAAQELYDGVSAVIGDDR